LLLKAEIQAFVVVKKKTIKYNGKNSAVSLQSNL
jgi:hypothetical protein